MGSSPLLPKVARRLEGKVALITGGASGIGACTAKQFRRHGAEVVIADIQDDLGQSVCEDLGSPDSYVHCEVTDEDPVRSAMDGVMAKYGKLDIVFNNAAIIEPSNKSILDTEKAYFERVHSVNLTAVFLGIKHAARAMISNRRGSIINNASIAGVMGGISPHAYTASKHGVVGLTKNAAVELGQFGIRVNCVSPYAVETPVMNRIFNLKGEELEKGFKAAANLKGASLKAEDVAEAVMYLGSDESKYVSGHNLVVDGGYTIVNPLFAMCNYAS